MGAGRWLAAVALPLAGFWALTLALDRADWNAGGRRLLWALATVAAVGAFARWRVSWRPTHAAIERAILAAWMVAALGLGAWRVGQGVRAVQQGRGPTVDIGQTTVTSVELRARGANPYVERIDRFGARVDPQGTGWRHFAGFKYGPAMTWLYTPGVRLGGNRGFIATNLVLLLALAALAGWLAVAGEVPADSPRRVWAAACAAAALVLAGSFIEHEAFEVGANDLGPVALLLGALAARLRGRPLLAGVLCGASAGAKLMPAAALAWPLLFVGAARGRFVLAAVLTAAAIYAPALIASPVEVISNLVIFNGVRPVDSTSWLAGRPAALATALGIASILAAPMGALFWARRRGAQAPAPAHVALVAAAAVVVAFCGSRTVHRNYLFWLVPFCAVAAVGRVRSRYGSS